MSMDFTYVLLGVPSPDTTSRLVSPNAVKPNEHTQRETPLRHGQQRWLCCGQHATLPRSLVRILLTESFTPFARREVFPMTVFAGEVIGSFLACRSSKLRAPASLVVNCWRSSERHATLLHLNFSESSAESQLLAAAAQTHS